MRGHIYKHDKLVIGSSVSALLYSYFNNVPVLFTDIRKPKFFEHFGLNVNIDKLGAGTESSTLVTNTGNHMVGIPKNYIWGRLVYLLSYAGLLPLSDKATSIRIEDENILRVTTEYSRFVKFKFNELLVFGDDNLYGITSEENEVYEVLDWMNVRSGMVHKFDKIENESDLVRHIYFYPSGRIDGAHDKKDLVAVSYLTKEQLSDFDYSDTYARFVVEDLMRICGIRGRRNGRDTKNPNLYRHYSIKVETAEREINNIKNLYSPHDNIKIMNLSDEQLLQEYNNTGNDYIEKLLRYFADADT